MIAAMRCGLVFFLLMQFSVFASAVVVAEYRFDEVSWNGTADEVIDSSLNARHGAAFNADLTKGLLCNAADLSSDSATDYISINNEAMNGLSNFTVSIWLQSITGDDWQTVLSGAAGNSGLLANELTMLFEGETTFHPIISESFFNDSPSVTVNNITDGNWHHYVWTQNATNFESCLYVNGALQACVNQPDADDNDSLTIASGGLIIGQDQDNVGGGFDDDQDWQGLLDELIIFDQVLSLSEVQSIRNNQLSGNNWDGTARSCNTTPPQVDEPEMLAGRVTLNDTATKPEFVSVCFDQPFSEPPLVFTLADLTGEPAVVRIKDVTTTGFSIAQVESVGTDGPHEAQTVDFLAIVPGIYQLDGGARLEVGSFDTTSHQGRRNSGRSWDDINFDTPFSAIPAVITSIQTMNNESGTPPGQPSMPFLSTAVRSVTVDDFDFALERAETNTGSVSVAETVGFMAIDDGAIGMLNSSIGYEAIRTADSIRGNGTCIATNFAGSYSEPPLIVGSQMRRDGGDGGWLGRCSISNTSVGLFINEDIDGDNERNHTNERAGLLVLSGNFNDYTSSCAAAPIVEYRFDESGWNGTTDEVLDSLSTLQHGVAVGGATTTANGQVCGAATFDGVNDYLTINGIDTYLTASSSMSFWVKTTQNGDNTNWRAPGISGIEQSGGLNDIFWGWIDANGRIGVGSGDSNHAQSSSAINNNNWRHIVLTRDAATGEVNTYVDGSLEDTATSQAGGSLGFSSIGRIEDTGGSPEYYAGELDELLIFDEVINADDVTEIYNNQSAGRGWDGSTRSCPITGPDHFTIVHDNAGIHCLDEPITVSARNVDNSVLTSYTGTITLDTQTGTGDWSLSSGSGTLDNGTPNDGVATYLYNGSDSGSAVFFLSYKEGPVSINIAVNDGAVVDDNTEGNLVFANSGFTVTGSALSNPPPSPINDPIANHIAGDEFEIHLAVYGTTPDDPQCGIIETYTGAKTITLGTNYSNPTLGTRSVQGGGNITFANGQGVIDASYLDAGEISVSVSDGTLSGGSNNFVVKPDRFLVELSGSNQTAADASGSVYTTAGSTFTVTVTAQTAEVSGSRITTLNFGNEISPEAVELLHSLVAPAGGAAGSLTGSLGKTGAGVFSGDFSWDEVGIIDLNADLSDNDYLGAGNVTGTMEDVGRFIPSYFKVEKNTLINRYSSGCSSSNFTYMDETFNVSFDLDAVNNAGEITENYIGDFAKLTDPTDLNLGASNLNVDLSFRLDQSAAAVPAWSSGEVTLSFDVGIDRLGTVDGPLSNLIVSVDPADSDTVGVLASDRNVDMDGDTINDAIDVGETEIRYGRVFLENAFGPVERDLPVPFSVQYFNGTSFAPNINDSCTSYIDTDAVLHDGSCIDKLVSGETEVIYPDTSTIYSDDSQFILQAPSVSSYGCVDIQFNVPSYLQFDWNGDGSATSPRSTATFGGYRGNDRVIYRREVLQ